MLFWNFFGNHAHGGFLFHNRFQRDITLKFSSGETVRISPGDARAHTVTSRLSCNVHVHLPNLGAFAVENSEIAASCGAFEHDGEGWKDIIIDGKFVRDNIDKQFVRTT